MIQEYIRREGDGKATGRRRGGASGRRVAAARHGGASNVPRPPSFVLPSLSFQTRWVRRSHPSVVRPFLVRAPLSFVRRSRSFATLPFLVRSPPSVVRHSPATLSPPNPRASRDSGERRRGGLERPHVESLKPNVPSRRPTPTRIAVPASASPRESPPAREVATTRAPNSRRDRVSPRGRVPLVRRASPRDARLRCAIAAPRRAEIHERRSTSDSTTLPRRERPRRARHRHAKSSIPSPPLRGNSV